MTVKEGQEYTGFLREDSDRLERSEVDEVEEFVDGCSCRQVSNVNGTCSCMGIARHDGGECSGGVGSGCRWNVDIQ